MDPWPLRVLSRREGKGREGKGTERKEREGKKREGKGKGGEGREGAVEGIIWGCSGGSFSLSCSSGVSWAGGKLELGSLRPASFSFIGLLK